MERTVSEIIAWALNTGLEGQNKADLVAGYCERLTHAGLPLWRAAVGTDTLDPRFGAEGQHWMSGEGVHQEVYLRARSAEQEAEWLRSPWFWQIDTETLQMRRNLASGEGTNEFPLLASLAGQGGTDYYSTITIYGDRGSLGDARGVASSWTTRRAGGFSDDEIALIDATLPAFALAYKSTLLIDTARTLLSTYLGTEPAKRVLRGEIERGKANTERKVLWFSDLTGSTRIADTLPREELLDLLNAYADCLVGVVHRHGGEVLKFMGDGILAVFDATAVESCQQALDAVEFAVTEVDRLNRDRAAAGRPVIGFTIALHVGDVLYGNVGSQDRLDFTVVGPAVNEVTRIQSLSRSLDQPILVSGAFADACGSERARLVSVGRYALRGVGRPQELFTMDLVDPAAAGR